MLSKQVELMAQKKETADNEIRPSAKPEVHNSSKIVLLLLLLLFKKNIIITITISSVLKITITIILLLLLLKLTRVITNMIIIVTLNKLT